MNLVLSLVSDLKTKIKYIPSLGNRVVVVANLEDLAAQTSRLPKPAVGIMYEGARSVSKEVQPGVSAEAVFSLILVTDGGGLSKTVDMDSPAHATLDYLRLAVHGTRSPAGHYWRWNLEAPAAAKGTFEIWLQRWSTPIQVVPKKV
jgi:hypothetical protein